MFVVDVLRYDIEKLSSILRLLNATDDIGWREFWPRDFTEDDVIPALEALLQEGRIRALRDDESLDALVRVDFVPIPDWFHIFWFELTAAGWEAWEEWEPPRDC